MSLRCFVPAACAAFVLSPAALSQVVTPPPPPGHEPTARDDAPRRAIDQRPRSGAFIGLGIPRPLSRADFVRALEFCVLSDTQMAFALREYDDSQHADFVWRTEHETPLWEQSQDLHARLHAPDAPDLSDDFKALFDARTRAVRSIRQREQNLFLALEPMLTDAQSHRLTLVRHHRQRTCDRQFPSKYPGARLDLTDVLLFGADAWLDHQDLADDDLLMLLVEYDGALTPLESTRARRHVRLVIESQAIQSRQATLALTFESDPSRRAAYLALKDELAQHRRRELRTAVSISALNQRMAERIAERLPEDLAAALRTHVREACFPRIHPDPTDVTAILDAARQLSDLTDEQIDALTAIEQSYREQRDPLLRAMERDADDWTRATIERGYGFAAYDAFCATMRTRHDARRRVAEQAEQRLEEMLSADQFRALAPLRQKRTDALARFDRRLEDGVSGSDAWPPPHPDLPRHTRRANASDQRAPAPGSGLRPPPQRD